MRETVLPVPQLRKTSSILLALVSPGHNKVFFLFSSLKAASVFKIFHTSLSSLNVHSASSWKLLLRLQSTRTHRGGSQEGNSTLELVHLYNLNNSDIDQMESYGKVTADGIIAQWYKPTSTSLFWE